MSEKKKYKRKDTSELDPIRVQVPEWLAKQHDIPEDLTGYLVAQSSKAVLVRVTETKEVWLPKSQIKELPLSLMTFFKKPSKPLDSIKLDTI